MSTLSYPYIRDLGSIFSHYGNTRYFHPMDYSETPQLNKFMEVDLTSGTFEYPVTMGDNLKGIFEACFKNGKVHIDKIVIPVHVEGVDSRIHKTSDSMMRSFCNSVGGTAIVKLYGPNDQSWYYGNRGIIFDRDFHPLFLCTYRAAIEHESQDSIRIRYLNKLCYIDKSVILNQNAFINKCLIKKVLPYFANPSYLMGCPTITPYTIGRCENDVVDISVIDLQEKFVDIKELPLSMSSSDFAKELSASTSNQTYVHREDRCIF